VGFEHFGDGGVLGAEAETGGEVETDAGVGFARTRDDHRRHRAGAAVVAGFDWARELMRLGDEVGVVCGCGSRDSCTYLRGPLRGRSLLCLSW
jgi:hypothetical protein